MNRRLATILSFAFVIALGCSYLVYRIVASQIAVSRPIATTRALAAANDLKTGAVITAQDLTTVDFVGQAPPGALLKPEAVIGRGVITAINRGEPLFEIHLAAPGSGGGMASMIPKGMRAIAVRVDDVVGVAGFATPGMRVDVLVSGTLEGAATMSTRTLLQNVEVLSAGTDIQKDTKGEPRQVQVVNLLVKPEEAQRISLAGSQLRIQLALRNPLDTEVVTVPGTAMTSLFGGAPAAPVHTAGPPRKAEPKTYSVDVINGSKSTQEKFDTGGKN